LFSLCRLNEEISRRSNAAYHRAGITYGDSSAGCLAANFLFATIWKILAGEYWDGAFLHYTFLADDRVESVATAIGGLSPNALPQNRLLETLLKQFPQAIGMPP
jgi:hypothetical protein